MKKKNSVHPVTGQNNQTKITLQHEQTQLYQGPIPPPDILQKFDDLVPGTAQQLIQLAVDESLHRRRIEQQTIDHNIAISQEQLKASTKTERISQTLGFVVVSACIASALYLSTRSPVVAGLFISIPMVSVVKAFLKKP